MDLKARQTTLREFAAEREWQPFHTPKNLAMALMVEAAELAEIFHWMTPEQSQAARGDLVLQEQVADEVADVLLYLVQIADHTGIDLKRAVGRKLVKNSKKHPPLRPGLPGFRVGTGAAGDTETHVLVDWENVQPKDADIRSLVPDVTDIWLFHGPNQKGVAAKHTSFGEKATPVKIARSGKNALDFHLSFYMGYIAARHPDARFVVVSNDKGYAPMLEHAAELGFSVRQVGFGKSGAVVEAASASSAAKKAAPAEKVTPDEADEVLNFGMSLLEDVLRPDDGDGPWHDGLTPPASCEAALAGYLWVGLGSPMAARRWEAAHAVRICTELSWTDLLSALAAHASAGTSTPFVDKGLTFYEWHARQWLLIGLARGVLEQSAAVLPFVPFLSASAREEHVAIRHFAALTLKALHAAGHLPAEDVAGLGSCA